MSKPRKPAKQQGVRGRYLGLAGRFRLGLDAMLERDLIHAALGLKNPKALHSFTAAHVTRLLKARGWERFLASKRAALAAGAKR